MCRCLMKKIVMKRNVFIKLLISACVSTVLIFVSCLFYSCDSSDNVDTPEVPEPPFVYHSFEPIELTAKQGEKASADNHFTFKMFKEVSVLNGQNTFFSPLSLNMALGMLYNGASGDTRTEMAEALGLADFSDAEINKYYQKISQSLQEIDPLTEIGIANSIWCRDGFSVKQPFFDINQTYFDATVRTLDFNKPDAADIINNWCAEKTKDRIKEIVEKPIANEAMMYLINALYFKGRWESVFNEKLTKQDVFTNSDNQEQKVNMMTQTTFFPYYEDSYLQSVELPYGNRAFGMVVILPANNRSLDRLIEYLEEEDVAWQNIVENMNLNWREVHLKLPRFETKCEFVLNEPVMNVGMKKIFSGGFANISDDDLFVSGIKQKTFVSVNEEGSEAAAITVIGMYTADFPDVPPPPPVPFFANRPFLYLIKEKSTGVILFIGRMDDPAK